MKNILYAVFAMGIFVPVCQSQEVIHNLKDKPLTVASFDKAKYSKEKSAIYFEPEVGKVGQGRLIVNLSTKGQDNITLSWQNNTAKKVKTQWSARLQYCLDGDEGWKDVKDSKGKSVVYYSQYKRYKRNFTNISLPSECNDRDCVRVCWKIEPGRNKNNDPGILFFNIHIKSDYDKYMGAEAKVDVFLSEQDNEIVAEDIVFDNIALPYVYPEVKRLRIDSKNIRDSIILDLEGKDAKDFSLSHYSLKDKQTDGKYIFITYAPKTAGRHEAYLTLKTAHLSQGTIRIPVEGSCFEHKSYGTNYMANTGRKASDFFYSMPVFSNTDYQLYFTATKASESKVCVNYKWYRDDRVLFEMNDTLNSSYYCAPLKAPSKADKLEVHLYSQQEFEVNNSYFGTPKVKTMIKSGLWSDDSNWKEGDCPAMEDFVVIDKGVKAEVDKDATCTMLILEDSANVIVGNGVMFYVSSDIFYNQKSFFTVYQYLKPERWNYISSPVNQAHAAMFSMKNDKNESWLMQYNTGVKSKMDDYWSEYITDPKFTLTPARGYAVYTHEPLNVKYEGLLCAGSIAVSLKSTPEDRWNLLGNPYTAPLSSKKLYAELDGKIQGNVLMIYDRETHVYNPLIVDPKEEIMIPSLESFFVEAYKRPSNILFKRSQQYIPVTSDRAQSNHNYLNLSVSKDGHRQYVLLGMDSLSSYGFDDNDCHKMFGNGEDMPDIYLKDDKDEYSVSVFPDYPMTADIGLYIGNPSQVEISLNNLSVLPEYALALVEDKQDGSFDNLCFAPIETDLNSGTTERYRLHLIKSLSFEELGGYCGVFLWTDNGRCMVFSTGQNELKKIRIKNMDSKLESERRYESAQVWQLALKKGKYLADLYINDIWINNIEIEIK